MSQASFEQFREHVLQDPDLQRRLRETDRDSFIDLVLQLGQAHGYDVTAEDVAAAMQASRRAWLERWIV